MSEIAEMLTRDEQAILRGWFEDCGDCLTDDERAKRCKLRGWSMGKRRVVEGILGRLREGGVYVSGLDSLGGWVYGRRVPSRIDQELQERADEWEARGKAVLEQHGFAGAVRRLGDA